MVFSKNSKGETLYFCERCKLPKTKKQGGHAFRICLECAQMMLSSVHIVMNGLTRMTVKELLNISGLNKKGI